MKQLKTWQLVLVAVTITLATGLVMSPVQAFDGRTRWGFPDFWLIRGTEVGVPIDAQALEFVPLGFLIDAAIWFVVVWLVNRVFLKHR